MTIFEGADFTDRDFRRGIWHETATMVAMVTTAHDGRENVMACEWAMMVSTNPMRFVVSIGPQHATHDLIEAAGEFGLNFCADTQARLSHVSGSYSLNDTNKWELADFPTYVAKKIRAPMIEGCVVNAECRLISTQPLGDHTLFVGEALWARSDSDRNPLFYHGGKYFFLGAQIPKD